MAETVTIARRYRGPLDSANGGYAAGLLGARLGGTAEVTLRLPPSLECAVTGRVSASIPVRSPDATDRSGSYCADALTR